MGPTEFIAALRRGKLEVAYFFRGPDRFLQEECRRALVASIPVEARAWCLADIEFQPGCLERELQGAQQMPMMGGHSLLLLSDPEDFKHASDEDYEALAAYLERPSPFATVVFIAVEPDRRRRFIQLLEKQTDVVEMLPLARRAAAAWVVDFPRQAGVEIAADLAEELTAKFEISRDAPGDLKRAGVNLLWLRTELEKLLTAKLGARRLERDDVDLVVAFREEHVIGKLLRAIAERQFGEALEHLRALLASKEPETLLLWCIGDLFRQALKSSSRASFEHGPAPSRAGRGPRYPGGGGWNRRASPFSTLEVAQIALRTYSGPELLQAMRLVRQADLSIKSAWKDSRILLEFLVWQMIAGKSSRGLQPAAEELPMPAAEP